MNTVADKLTQDPGRGLGAANSLANEALQSKATLAGLVSALSDSRARVQERAANALKKVQESAPELLHPYAKRILQAALACEVLQGRWNLTMLLGQLPLKGAEKALAVELMFEALGSDSVFLRVFALQGLADLATQDEALWGRLKPLLETAAEDRSAALRARARKLLKTRESAKKLKAR